MWRSQNRENGCLYSIHKEKTDFYIELNPIWDEYLHTHYRILMDFTYWNLTQFLQVRNPNVPAISSKLIRPESRSSLANPHRYWNKVIQLGGPVRCIYTGHELHASDYGKHSVNHVFSSPTSIINFTSKKPSYDDTRRSGRDNELLQRAQNDL